MTDHTVFRFTERLPAIEEYTDSQERREAREVHDRELEDFLSNLVVTENQPGPGGPSSDDRYGDLVLSMGPWAYWRLGERGLGQSGLIAKDSSGFGRDAIYRTTRFGRYAPVGFGDVGNIGTPDPADFDGLTLGVPALPSGTSDTAARFLNQLAWVEYLGWPWHLQFSVAWWAYLTHDNSGDDAFDITMMLHAWGTTGDYDESSTWVEDQYAAEQALWGFNPYAVAPTFSLGAGFNYGAFSYPNLGGSYDLATKHLFAVRQTAVNLVGSASGAIDADTASHFVTVGQWDATRFYVPGEIVTHITSGWQLCLQQNINVTPADDGTIWEVLSFDSTAFDVFVDGVLVNSGSGYGSTPSDPSFDRFLFGQPPNSDDWINTVDGENASDLDEVAVFSRPLTDAEIAALYAFRR